MDLKGPMFGIYYNLAFQPESTEFRFALETYAARGSTRYNSVGSGNLKNDLLGVFEGRLLGSYTITLKNNWIIEDYIGIGTRYLVNPKNSHLTTTGHSTYDRESHYYYIPIGIRIIKPLDNELQFIAYVEYDNLLSGLQKIYLDIVTKNRQPHGYVDRIGVDLYLPSSTYCLDYTMGVFAR